MNSRELAIKELMEGLTNKFGSDSASKSIILSEIQKFSQSKSKISVEDIDNLENNIKRLCGFSKSTNSTYKNFSPCLSKRSTKEYDFKPAPNTKTADSDRNVFNSSIEAYKVIDDSPLKIKKSMYRSKEPVPNTYFYKGSGKKIVSKSPDHTLFPNGSSLNNLTFDESLNINKSYSKALGSLDDWGKIIKADHIKFLQVTEK
jgi:hypothetical protein